MKKLINKLAHACGLYTADDVEYIEKQWQDKIDRLQSLPVKLSAMGAGGKGGHGHGQWSIPAAIDEVHTNPLKPSQSLRASSPIGGTKPSIATTQRLTGPERRELAHEAARWCKQQNIEVSPENIIFYLDDRRMISAPTPEMKG